MSKADIIIQKLEELFPNPKIPLFHKDPYTLLVAVILSAQSTDKKVNQITPKLFDAADTPEKMLLLGEEKLRQTIREIGLANTKAKNIVTMWELFVLSVRVK
ncbi:MAG: endonuclease III domain-containing protein, partial [Candidatus Dojkabacteria bacterium]